MAALGRQRARVNPVAGRETRAGLAEIDASLRALSDDEPRALVERARQRASDLSQDEVAAIIAEVAVGDPRSRARREREGLEIDRRIRDALIALNP